MTAQIVKKEIIEKSDAYKAEQMQRFFKTGTGQYGEGDIFVGISNPNLRVIAKNNVSISFNEVKLLLSSKIHEDRLCAAMILTYKFEKAKRNPERQKEIYDFYMNNLEGINNWDLVDLSSYKIAGAYLLDKDRSDLYKLSESGNLWLERIAVISTMTFIKNDDYQTTFDFARRHLHHKHDLMHKAIGWMLREIGKRNQAIEEAFLLEHYQEMPRTMLRYAIEKFDETTRQDYLKGKL